jgi:mannose-6-phosphate isomerase-like protein (cupin superfamily)
MMKLTVQGALDKLSKHTSTFIQLFTHGTLEMEIFKPKEVDVQRPHAKDEVYVITTGSGHFLLENERTPVQAGDVLFVPAGARHRFVDFTDDFSTWVFFYGPEGGEKATSVHQPGSA